MDDVNPQGHDQLDRQQGISAAGHAAAYSDAMALSQLASMKPDKLEGGKVVKDNGEKVGEIEKIARSNGEAALYAVVDMDGDKQTAVKLSELSVNALAYTESADSLADAEIDYDSSSYERISHNQYGAKNARDPGLTNQGQPGANPPPLAGRNNELGQSDQSAIAQLVMNEADQMEGVKLIDEDGQELGEINHFARSLRGDGIVAVIDRKQGSGQAAVELEDLDIAELRFEGDVDQLDEQRFEESEYQILSSAF